MNKYIFYLLFQAHPFFKAEKNWFEKVSTHPAEFFEDEAWLEAFVLPEKPVLFQFWKEQLSLRNKIWSDVCRQYQQGVRFVVRGDRDYPEAFCRVDDPPWVLSYWGHLSCLQRKSLSVVGGREISPLSESWMEKHLRPFLNESLCTVVSGGARGVDQWAHLLALREKLPTAIVLPSGLGHIYPSSLESLKEEVIEKGGVLLSEFHFSCRMQKSFFPHRNRLIAAAGVATLVVQAGARSGTLITAHRAAHLGRPVWVVPGHPEDLAFKGSLELLMEGATMVNHAHELSAYWHEEVKFLNNSMPSIDGRKHQHH